MSRIKRAKPSPALVVSLVALFVALGSGAYAASKIGTKDIKNQAVTGKKLAKNAVKSNKTKDGGLKGKDLKDGTIKVRQVGAIERFKRRTGVGPEESVLTLSGLELRYSCSGPDLAVRPSLSAATKSDNAFIDLGFTTGGEGFGSSFSAQDFDFDRNESFDLSRGKTFGQGEATYSTASGEVVTLIYGFSADAGGEGCLAHGVAIGG